MGVVPINHRELISVMHKVRIRLWAEGPHRHLHVGLAQLKSLTDNPLCVFLSGDPGPRCYLPLRVGMARGLLRLTSFRGFS